MSHNENKHDQLQVFCPKCFNAFTNENAFEQHRTECSHQGNNFFSFFLMVVVLFFNILNLTIVLFVSVPVRKAIQALGV